MPDRKEYMRWWRSLDSSKEKKKESDKKYYESNKDKRKKYLHEYYVKNQDEISQRHADYNAEHRAENTARASEWQKLNKDKVAAKFARRRARESNGNFTAQDWEELCDRYGNICLCCREHKPLTPDHVIPLSKGGSNTIDNIQPLCRNCNTKKNARHIDYR